MRRRAGIVIALSAAVCCLAAPSALAAKDKTVWLCKPGLADNPCELPLDTTVREVGKPDRVETPKAGPRGIDCFYVYPTVSNQPTANADKSRDPEVVSIAKFQAARFSQECRVFAPIYRQSTLASIASGYASASGADRQLAYADVLEAWRAYLAQDNASEALRHYRLFEGLLESKLALRPSPRLQELMRMVTIQ